MEHVERILIVGGGIGGLTLATALHQHSFTVELVERSPSWRAVGAGIAVQPNGVRILRALGMGAAIEQARTVIRHWDFCDQQGEALCEIDLEGLWGDVGPFVGVERTELQRVLLAGAAAVPSRHLRHITEPTGRTSLGTKSDTRVGAHVCFARPVRRTPTDTEGEARVA